MNTIVFCNVGTQDVFCDEKELQSLPARRKGKLLLEQKSSIAGRLAFPVIEIVLDYVLRAADNRVDQLIFIGTDQEDQEYREWDTLYSEILDTYFDLGELQGLCFDLGIDYENLGGSTKQVKVRELIGYSQRHGRLPELIATCRDRRAHAPWWEDSEQRLPEGENLRTICDALHRIDRLVPLRNDSIIAHGYAGVSEEIIMREYCPSGEDECSSPVEDMAAICSALGISMINPFRDIRDFVINELR